MPAKHDAPELEPQLAWLANMIVGAALSVHEQLGPSRDAAAYEDALAVELEYRGLRFDRRRTIQLIDRRENKVIEQPVSFVVDEQIIVELKPREDLDVKELKRTLPLLRTSGFRMAILISFNTRSIKDGIKRLVLT
jgi:GxxExxY protein